MKHLAVLGLVAILAANLQAEPKGVDLARLDGWDIVLGAEAIPSERYAAEEFQRLFAQASGIRLPIVATAADRFICIVDETKLVERLGAFPLPVEVIPMARRHVARAIEALGGRPLERDGFTTDNGNVILDVHGLEVTDARVLETVLNQIPGVVANGLFAHRPADIVLVGSDSGVRRIG